MSTLGHLVKIAIGPRLAESTNMGVLSHPLVVGLASSPHVLWIEQGLGTVHRLLSVSIETCLCSSITMLASGGPLRAFPVVYVPMDVNRSADFWQRLGFDRVVELPLDREPGYVGMRRGDSEIAIVAWDWPAQRYGLKPPAGPRFEMYVYVEDLDTLLAELRRDGIAVLADAADTPWGERAATIADPDGNPVTLCLAQDG
jgi:lactoylglutathione lyase